VPIRSILLLLAVVSLAGVPYVVLMPVIATKVLGGGAQLYGFLMAASGLGALIGALYLATQRTVVGFARKIAFAAGTFGVAIMLFALSRLTPFSLILMVVIGLGMMVQIAASNTVLQMVVEEDKRGRIMSLYTIAFLGMAPFGSLLAGSLANTIGAPMTLMIGGTVCVAGAILFAIKLPYLRKAIRPVYARMGIIPQVTSGIDSVSGSARPAGD
jgi:MFS family permease